MSLIQDLGETPRVTCDGTVADDSNCFCKCTNGANLERTFSQIFQGNGATSSCTGESEKVKKDGQACTLRERDLSHQVETCAAREQHSTDQLDACNARGNELVDKLGSCAAREKNSLTQLEAAQKQTALDASTMLELKAQIDKLEAKMPQYTYKACYPDATSARILNGASTSDSNMTASQCSVFCKAFRYFGTQYGNQCFCGNELAATPVPVSGCDWPCRGSNLENCGGNARMNTYENLKV